MMKKIHFLVYTLLVATSVFAQTPQPPTPNYQVKLDSILKPLSNITIPELKDDVYGWHYPQHLAFWEKNNMPSALL